MTAYRPAGPGPGIVVRGLGAALGPDYVDNHHYAARIDTSHDWIVTRTGIHSRNLGGRTGDMAVAAATEAMIEAGVNAADIDFLILATETPDAVMPATSSVVAGALGLTCPAMDLNAACAGFVYGIVTAAGLFAAGCEHILLIGSDAMGSITDQADRRTAVLFGDGAGAMVLSRADDDTAGLMGWGAGTNGDLGHILSCRHGGKIEMNGKEVFRNAVRVVVDSCEQAMKMAGVTADDIDMFVPHQANIRIIDACARRLGIPETKWAVVLDHTGNTSAASVPLALYKAATNEELDHGDIVLCSGFGAGMTWASAVWSWHDAGMLREPELIDHSNLPPKPRFLR